MLRQENCELKGQSEQHILYLKKFLKNRTDTCDYLLPLLTVLENRIKLTKHFLGGQVVLEKLLVLTLSIFTKSLFSNLQSWLAMTRSHRDETIGG